LHFGLFNSQKVHIGSSKGVSKNLSFYTDFKNVHLTLEKSIQKSFAQKIDFLGFFIGQNSFLANAFLGALFTKIKCTFLKSVQ
jgi:hypothetical protein